MYRYKGTYGHGMKQYMPNKPVKFGFKVWAAADSDSKYFYNFQFYRGSSGFEEEFANNATGRGEDWL